ncbi:hypothetical protein O3G_MSEX014100, partial [Manduca sexta]
QAGRMCGSICSAINHIFILGARSAAGGVDSAVTAICDTPIAVQLNFNRFEGEPHY